MTRLGLHAVRLTPARVEGLRAGLEWPGRAVPRKVAEYLVAHGLARRPFPESPWCVFTTSSGRELLAISEEESWGSA